MYVCVSIGTSTYTCNSPIMALRVPVTPASSKKSSRTVSTRFFIKFLPIQVF